MKYFFLIVFSLSISAFSQKSKYLSFEVAGSGGLGSLNYENAFFESEKMDLHFRAGLSFAPVDKNNGIGIVFPLMVHTILGAGNHKADIGLGQTFTITTKGSFFVRMPFSVGYRFEPAEKRYYLRASYTPIISYLFNFQWENWAGLTFGYRLTK